MRQMKSEWTTDYVTIIKWSETVALFVCLLTIQGIKMSPPSWVKPSSPPLGPGIQMEEGKKKTIPLPFGNKTRGIDCRGLGSGG